ncbi:hypothetical protein NM208_g10884 [Fusarium decemcellulare]|uniref:Uncharacterized protein n=1 Tax=Fusarium decemcellulare TaxID=57161 RepID=A0ACC1RWC2_9HYPO|nr:hypothetical protein NM208_g10884 [Fusarium decemcellulare]
MLCEACNTAQYCGIDTNGLVLPGEWETIAAYANAEYQSLSSRYKNTSFYVEDTINNLWRCFLCDWSYSLFGQEVPYGLKHQPTEEQLAVAAKPIPHHRFSSTSCSLCGLYISFSDWEAIPGGGFRCGMCSPRHCANKYCTKHKAIALCFSVRDDDLDDWFCHPCAQTNMRRKRQHQAKLKHFKRALRRVPADRRCGNPNCGRRRTATRKTPWCFLKGHPREEANVRCLACYNCHLRYGKERLPRHSKEDGMRVCFNCSRVEMPEDGRNFRWLKVKDMPGKWRCENCGKYFRKHKRERIPPAEGKTRRRAITTE